MRSLLEEVLVNGKLLGRRLPAGNGKEAYKKTERLLRQIRKCPEMCCCLMLPAVLFNMPCMQCSKKAESRKF